MADEAYSDFKSLVNMTSKELEEWLQTDESQSVGIKKGTSSDKKTDADGTESIGHESGRKILDILSKKEGDLNDDDLGHIKKVNAYIKRHKAQRPAKEDIENSRWRYSLMNWGHDPSKE
ncbi:DUF3140 domain-containing protein [Arthrobacter sp. MPF02]|uniref:DUF3140 domain-containing protein n=1 Tax=Arthrobacter sp. MPF02 TaxID=3388492 RepID=UPI0039854D50